MSDTEADDASVAIGATDRGVRTCRDRRGRDPAVWSVPSRRDRVEPNQFDRLADDDALSGADGPRVPRGIVGRRGPWEDLPRLIEPIPAHSERGRLTALMASLVEIAPSRGRGQGESS